MKSAADWAMDNIATTTAMSQTPVSACASNTDVRFVVSDLGDGTWGETRCPDPSAANPPVCDHFNVIQDHSSQVTTLHDASDPYSDGVEQAGELELNFKKTWCHEVGHAASLEHHPGVFANRASYYAAPGPDHVRDCMVRGHIEDADSWMRYNDHHKDDISARY